MIYENLVNRLRADADYMDNNGIMLYAAAPFYRECADAIEELSMKLNGDEAAIAGMKREIERMVRAEKPRWVSVTERLPEKRKWVLCRCEANIIEVLRWENNEWYHDPMHVYYPSFVTHWQPLPEPPKEEA